MLWSSSQSFIYHPARWSWILYQPSFAGSNIKKNQPNKTQTPNQFQLVKLLAVVKDGLKMLKPILWRIISNKERLYLNININTRQSSKLRESYLNNIILLSSMHNLSLLLLHNWSPKPTSCTIPNTMKSWQKHTWTSFLFPKDSTTSIKSSNCSFGNSLWAQCSICWISVFRSSAWSRKHNTQLLQLTEKGDCRGEWDSNSWTQGASAACQSLQNVSSTYVRVTLPSSSHHPCQSKLRLWEQHWHKFRGTSAGPEALSLNNQGWTQAEINPQGHSWHWSLILMFKMQVTSN